MEFAQNSLDASSARTRGDTGSPPTKKVFEGEGMGKIATFFSKDLNNPALQHDTGQGIDAIVKRLTSNQALTAADGESKLDNEINAAIAVGMTVIIGTAAGKNDPVAKNVIYKGPKMTEWKPLKSANSDKLPETNVKFKKDNQPTVAFLKLVWRLRVMNDRKEYLAETAAAEQKAKTNADADVEGDVDLVGSSGDSDNADEADSDPGPETKGDDGAPITTLSAGAQEAQKVIGKGTVARLIGGITEDDEKAITASAQAEFDEMKRAIDLAHGHKPGPKEKLNSSRKQLDDGPAALSRLGTGIASAAGKVASGVKDMAQYAASTAHSGYAASTAHSGYADLGFQFSPAGPGAPADGSIPPGAGAPGEDETKGPESTPGPSVPQIPLAQPLPSAPPLPPPSTPPVGPAPSAPPPPPNVAPLPPPPVPGGGGGAGGGGGSGVFGGGSQGLLELIRPQPPNPGPGLPAAVPPMGPTGPEGERKEDVNGEEYKGPEQVEDEDSTEMGDWPDRGTDYSAGGGMPTGPYAWQWSPYAGMMFGKGDPTRSMLAAHDVPLTSMQRREAMAMYRALNTTFHYDFVRASGAPPPRNDRELREVRVLVGGLAKAQSRDGTDAAVAVEEFLEQMGVQAEMRAAFEEEARMGGQMASGSNSGVNNKRGRLPQLPQLSR